MDTTNVSPLTEEEALEYAKIDRVFKRYQPRFAELKDKIKSYYQTSGKFLVGPVLISLTSRNSKDTKSAEAKYPIEKYPHLYKQVDVFQFDQLTERQQKPFIKPTLALSVDVVSEGPED